MDSSAPFPEELKVAPLPLVVLSFFLLTGWCDATNPTHRAVGSVVPEIELITGMETTTTLSSLRGKWVILQCGGSWSRNSDATGQVFAHIRKALEGKPFEFVEIFDDPSYLDVELFSFRTPAGLRALVARKRDLSFLRSAKLPAWYLLDPKGVVKAAGGIKEPTELRKEIGGILASDPTFPDFPQSPRPEEAALEKMIFFYAQRKHAEAEAEAKKILESEASNEIALEFLLLSSIWTQSYLGGNELLAGYLQNLQPSDRLLIFQALYRYVEKDNAENRATIRRYALKYPASQYLRCIVLMFDKLPESLTREEEDLLVTAKNTPLDEVVEIFRGFVLQSQGRHGQAESLFRKTRSVKRLGLLPLVLSLKRQGRDSEALDVIPFEADLNPENANPLNTWMKIHTNCVLQDWEGVESFARRYQELRPQNAQGFLVGWLAANILGRWDAAAEFRDQAMVLMKSSDRYRVAAELLEKSQLPGVDDLMPIGDLNVRFDTALLFILQEWGKSSDAASGLLATIQPAFEPNEWPYSTLEQLRTDSLPKFSVLNPDL